MHYLIVSFTHRNSTISIRERLAFSEEEQAGCLEKLNASPYITESILISTCNRMEVFCSVQSVSEGLEHIFVLLSERTAMSVEELEGRADIFEDHGAVHHLFSVASSLDSLVVGETQITGQLKDAFRFSFDNGFCGQQLSRAMHFAFKCAAAVRNSTDISLRPVSIASVAVAKLKEIVKNFDEKKALVIGVGEMSEITLKHLIASNVKVYLANRTQANADILAQKYSVETIEFSKIGKAVNEFEILFSATASSEPIITDKDIQECSFERYWFDMAMPRDISYTHGEKINLFQIDDLKSIVDTNMLLREDEAKHSMQIIGEQTMLFYEWLQTLSIEPIIKHMYQRAEIAAAIETSRVISKKYIPKEYEGELLKASKQALKRFLHDFTIKIRAISGESDADTIIESIKFLLDEEDTVLLNEYKCEHFLQG
jgi:glutamyl-tRNA reductase